MECDAIEQASGFNCLGFIISYLRNIGIKEMDTYTGQLTQIQKVEIDRKTRSRIKQGPSQLR
jgi:hypothetical protein